MQILGRICAVLGLVLVLQACGGGGGTRQVGTPKAVQATSYLNFKNVGLTPVNLPVMGDARGYGDFSRSGNLDLFTAELTYDVNRPLSQATPATFKFWKLMSNGSYAEDMEKLSSRAGCIHPRKALVADFNGDAIPDVFVACHGYDNTGFPGEKSRLLLSQPNGTFQNLEVLDVGYWHGATAFDVNGDGHVDLMLLNNNEAGRGITYLNDGRGNFTREAGNRFPESINSRGYYTIEAIDVNADGKQDLLLGGLEFSNSPTLVLFNPGNGNFSRVSSAALPQDSNFGIVLDFAVTSPGSKPVLWTMRTQHDNSYVGYALHKVDLSSLTGARVASSASGNWLRWIIPTTINGTAYIASDKAGDRFQFAY